MGLHITIIMHHHHHHHHRLFSKSISSKTIQAHRLQRLLHHRFHPRLISRPLALQPFRIVCPVFGREVDHLTTSCLVMRSHCPWPSVWPIFQIFQMVLRWQLKLLFTVKSKDCNQYRGWDFLREQKRGDFKPTLSTRLLVWIELFTWCICHGKAASSSHCALTPD